MPILRFGEQIFIIDTMRVKFNFRSFLIIIVASFVAFQTFINLEFIKSAQAITQIIWSDNFEGIGLPQWTLAGATNGNVITNNEAPTYLAPVSPKDGSKVMMVTSNGSGVPIATKQFGSPQQGTFSIWFYDTMATSAGTFVGIFNSDASETVMLGVNTGYSQDYYYYRSGNNNGAYGRSSNFRRTLGWHKFELVSTPYGSYGKIDGRSLSYLSNDGIAGVVNVNLKNFSKIIIASTWNLQSKAFYDKAEFYSLETMPSIIERERHFVNLFANQISSPAYGRSLNENTARDVADGAFALAMAGKYSQAQQAINKVIADHLQDYSSQGITRSQKWFPYSLTMIPFGMASWVSWNYLDVQTKQNVTDIIKMEANFWTNVVEKVKTFPASIPTEFSAESPYKYGKYIDIMNGYINDTKEEESSWRASFLSLAANMFPNDPNATAWESAARTYAFHTFSTGETYNGITTKTVYYNDSGVPNYVIGNHGYTPHPQYALGGGMEELAKGALFYLKVGKTIPYEFKHNVVNVWNAHQPYIDKQSHLFINSPLANTFGGKDDWGADDTWYNTAYVYYDILTGSNMIDTLTQFEYYIRNGFNAFPEGVSNNTNIGPDLKYLLDSVVAYRHGSALLFADSSRTLTPVILPTPTSIPPTATPVPPTSTATPIPPTHTPTPIPPTNTPVPCPRNRGDANCDYAINENDFNLWLGEYRGQSSSRNADFNSDGKVDLIDLEIWRRNSP